MNSGWKWITAGALCFLSATSVWAQDGLRGHWSGSVEVPNQALAMEVDLEKGPNGWIGSISIPAQNATGLPLDAISIAEGKCSFRIKGGPGAPTFSGVLSKDGKTISGDFTQAGNTFPFQFSRTGDPKVEETKASPALPKEFLGTWDGTLEGPGLRLVLKMSNEADGARAVFISVDQDGVEIPVSTIEQKAAKLNLVVKMIGGQYDGEINAAGSELNGTWMQGGNSMPLTLKKAPGDKKQ